MAPTILTFETKFNGRSLLEHVLRNPSSVGDATPPAEVVALGPAVAARADHGRWIADCPGDDCGGAEFVSFDNPVFFCCECRNAEWDHRLLPVLLPGAKIKGQVEAYLCARPVPATRNWHPSETVKQLRDENREHGIRL